MNSESEYLESVEVNGGIMNVSSAEYAESVGGPKIHDNGFCMVEGNDANEPFSKMKGKKYECSGSVSLPSVEIKHNSSPSSALVSKGYGLKKWRRIKRDSNKVGDGGIDTGSAVILAMPNLGENSSKRMQAFCERKKKSECSVSSKNAMVQSLDDFDLLDDSGFETGPSFAARTDFGNDEDQSSNSSTPATAPMIRGETSFALGFPHDKSRVRSSIVKNIGLPMQMDRQGKDRIEANKKSREDKVNIEKEYSHSSVESDLQRSNCVFVQGIYSTSNGIQSEKSAEYDEYKGDEVQGIGHRGSNGQQGGCSKDGAGGFEDFSPELAGAASSCEVNRSQNNGSSADVDPLAESIIQLQSVKEALENEVLKFREICKDASVDDLAQDLTLELTDNQILKETSSELFQLHEGMQRFSFASQSEVLETENADVEELFRQKIEADVEYLAISRTVQNLKVITLNQITILEEQRKLVSKQTQLHHKLGDTEKKTLALNKEAEKLENFYEDIMSADETLKMQKRVCKYTSCFFLQLVALILVTGIFISQLSPKHADVVPT